MALPNDHSGTIPTANTSTLLLAANTATSALLLQNISGNANLHVNWGAAASRGAGSVLLYPGDCVDSNVVPVNVHLYGLAESDGLPYTLKTD